MFRPARNSRARLSRAALALAGVVAVGVGVPAPAAAAPSAPAHATIDHITHLSSRWLQVFVRSPSMRRIVQVDLLLPANTAVPRPTVYMLQGGAGVLPNQSDWTYQGGAVRFFADKEVNVVLPVGAPDSYYTDWKRDDPVLGHQKWETFLTKEIPPLFDARFDGNGANAVVGTSMGAQAAVMLAERTGDLFRAVAAFSGCYFTSDPFGQAELRYVISSGGATPDDMWGPPDDPDWIAHDTLINAGKLRGKALYISTGSGLPGRYETPATPDLPDVAVGGGAIEATTDYCTGHLRDRLQRLGIPARFVFDSTGTHSWPYWQDQLVASWPDLDRALRRE